MDRIYTLKDGQHVIARKRLGESVYDAELESGAKMTDEQWDEYCELVRRHLYRLTEPTRRQ
jgi:hypothetical protein